MFINIIVDGLPKSCIDVHDLDNSCPGAYHLQSHWLCKYRNIPIQPYDPLTERPKWCPLISKDILENIVVKSEYENAWEFIRNIFLVAKEIER